MAKRNNQGPGEAGDRIKEALAKDPTMSLEELFAKLLPGAKEHSSDIQGTWDSDDPSNPIICIPKYAAVGDGKKFDKSKPSLLIFVELVHPCRVNVKSDNEDSEPVTEMAPKGALVGIWGKPGMRDMRDFCGQTILIVRDPKKDKDIGKGNDLKGYRIGHTTQPDKRIPILTDRRDASKGTRCFLDPEGYGKGMADTAGLRPEDAIR